MRETQYRNTGTVCEREVPAKSLVAVYMKEGRSYHQEDLRGRKNFKFGLNAEISVPCGYQVEEELKMAGKITSI